MSAAAFVVLAVLVVGSAAGVLLKRNPIHAALFLVMNLASVAGLYLTLGAEFLAAVQIIVYAGAIAVLFVFAIMVLIPGKAETGPDPLRRQRVMAAPLVGVFLILVMLALRAVPARGPAPPTAAVPGGVIALGRLLFTDYLFPFEVTSLLLLVAIVGVIALTKRRVESE
jgi:NADH-quinone oxidoreductase subunit J